MADVGVGLRIPFTAQKFGSFLIGRLGAPGGVKAPLLVWRASLVERVGAPRLLTRPSVIDVSGSLRPFSASQFGAAVAGAATVMTNPAANVRGSRRFIMWLPGERYCIHHGRG